MESKGVGYQVNKQQFGCCRFQKERSELAITYPNWLH